MCWDEEHVYTVLGLESSANKVRDTAVKAGRSFAFKNA